ncbi:MAG TPA: cytochrome c oxidase assembly protein [Gaiellaceae bacterium]|nr:cytochrome c oxidase assembly protein [Gaiellaceae bacterium]
MNWLLDPGLLSSLVVAGALLYALGLRRRLATGRRRAELLRRTTLLAAALILLDVVLSPAFDRYADESLTMHMLQHVVLMTVVPPLVVLAAPWLTAWRAIPLDARRSIAHGVLRLPGLLRRGLRGLVSPLPAFVLINADLGLWHVPWLYDLTLSNTVVHGVEHTSFLVFGTLFWIPILGSPPLHARLGWLQRAVYATAGAAAGWILALVLAFAAAPLYPAYAALPHRLGGLSAIGDQQLAAGVMLGIGSLPFTIAVFVFIYRWLDSERPAVRRRPSVSLTS